MKNKQNIWKSKDEIEAWNRSEEGKIVLSQFSKKIQELFIFLPEGKTYTDFIKEQEPKIKNTCNEIAAYIDKKFNIKPDPDGVYNFLLDEVDPISCLPKVDMDNLIILYSEWRTQKLNTAINLNSAYNNLFNELKNANYINTSFQIFEYVMLNKRLPIDSNKIQWLTKHSDAIYFMDNFKFTMPQFNECFKNITGTKFQIGSRSKSKRDKILKSIVESYKE